MSVMRPRAKRPHHRSALNRLWSASLLEPLEGRRLLTFVPAGPDFVVNSTTTNNQISPDIAMDADGDYVVVWAGLGQDGDGYGIFGQRFNSAGVAQGTEFQVNTYTSGNQVAPAVAMDPFGNFVVTWQSYFQDGNGYGVYAQRFDASATPQGTEFQVDNFTIGDEVQPDIAMDATGGFVIVWTTPSTIPHNENLTGIRANRYDGSGNLISGNIQINEYTSAEQNEPAVAMDANGEFIVTWSSNGQGASGYGVFAKRFNTFGVATSSEFAAGTNTARPQRNSTVALSDTGNYVIGWQSQNGPAIVRHFNSLNVPTTNDLVAAIWTATTSTTQNRPEVQLDADGNFVVLWTGPAGSPGVYGIKFSPDRTTTGGEFLVSSNTTQVANAVAFDISPSGDVVAVWGASTDIYSRILSDDAPTQTVTITRDVATVTEGDATQSVFTVTRAGGTSGDLLVQLTISGTATGGSLNDYTFTAATNVNLRTDYSRLLVTIPDGQTSITFTMVHNDDALVEGSQTAAAQINNSFNYNVGAPSSASVTIADNDVLDMVVEPTLLSIVEGSSLTFSVRLTAAPETSVVVDITKLVGGDADLTSNKSQLTFTTANFATAQVVTISAAQDVDDQIGQATFQVTGTGLTTANVLAVEADDEAAATATPGVPDLDAASDHGRSNTDNRTNLDNASAPRALTFNIPNTIAGATVKLYADGFEVGSAVAVGTTTTITTTGGRDLTDGNHTFTAKQTELGKITSSASVGLVVAVDTAAPVVTISEAGNQADPADTLPLRFALLFSDEVYDLTFDAVTLSGTANAQTLVITGSGRSYIANVSGISQSGTAVINLPAGVVHDVAGNASAAAVIIDNEIAYTYNQTLPPGSAPFASLASGKLTVNGTNTFDVITVLADGDDVVATVNGNGFRFAASGVTSIEVYGNEGNDRVTVGNGVIGTYVLGGNGNDTLIGGDGNDSLTGASGKDSLRGGAGDDRVAGGKHYDFVFGEAGNDRCYGDEATDYMDGGVDRDRMYGGDGDDTMLGNNHNDTLYGEAGNDSMDGQNHNDRLYPGTGRDTVKGGNGNDNIFAADGVGEADRAFGGDGSDGSASDSDDILDSIEFEIT